MPYSKMKFAVGLFVITLFLAIASFLYLVLQEKGTFDQRYDYHFSTSSANSFSIGMPLKFSGFNVGVIDAIALSDDGSVKMTFSVSEANKKWISEDCYLLLKKPLIGSPHIEIHATIGKKPLPPSSTLDIKMSDDINDMISKLEPAVDNIIKIISSVQKMTSAISKEDSDLFSTLKNLNTFSAKLANNDSLLTSITGDEASTKNIINSLNTTTQIMQEVHQITTQLNTIVANINEEMLKPSATLIQKLNLIMEDVQLKLETLDATVKAVGSYDEDLLHLKEQISVGLQKSNQIMDKVDSLMQTQENSEVKLP